MEKTTKQFSAGKKYYSRSICDHDCIFNIQVISRSPKMIKFVNWDGQIRSARIHEDEDGEYIQPDHYSMAPVYRACRELV